MRHSSADRFPKDTVDYMYRHVMRLSCGVAPLNASHDASYSWRIVRTMRRSAVVAALKELQDNSSDHTRESPRQLATGGGYGILQEQKPFKSPLLKKRGPDASLRKRARVNYSELSGDSVNQSGIYLSLIHI